MRTAKAIEAHAERAAERAALDPKRVNHARRLVRAAVRIGTLDLTEVVAELDAAAKDRR